MDYQDLLGSPVRIHQLVTALAVADTGSISAAGARLHTAQPAVSRTIRRLEEGVGLKLFDRQPRGMAPTPEGLLFLPHARTVLAHLVELENHLAAVRTGAVGTVRIGTLVAGAADLLPVSIARFTHKRPMARVSVVEATPDVLYSHLIDGDLDLVVGRLLPLVDRDFVQGEAFYNDAVRLIVRSGHPMAGAADLADLIDEQWILPPFDTALRSQLEQSFESAAGRVPRRVVECVAVPTIRRLLIEGDFIAALPSGALESDIRHGDLRMLEVSMAQSSVPVGVIRRTGASLSTICEEFINQLRSVAVPATKTGSNQT